MKSVYEILKENEELFKRMRKAQLCADDIRHLAMFEEYLQMRKEGIKVRYIASFLSSKYSVGEATFWRVIRKFKAPI